MTNATQGFHVVRMIPRHQTIDLARLEAAMRGEVRPGDAVVRSKEELLIVLPEAVSGARLATGRFQTLVKESSFPVDVRLVQRASQPHIKATIKRVHAGKIAIYPRTRPTSSPSEDPRYTDLLKRAGALHDRVKVLEAENSSLRLELGIERALKTPEKKGTRLWKRK